MGQTMAQLSPWGPSRDIVPELAAHPPFPAPYTQAATSTLNPAEILQLSAVWVQGCPFTGLSTAPARGLRWVREQLVAQAGLSWAPLDWLPDSLLVVPLGFPGCHREKCALLAANLIL